MIEVNIATLKAKLSFYLSRVKEGHEVTVLDRKTPVARLEPVRAPAGEITIIPAKRSPSTLKRLKYAPVKRKIDVVAILREDRDAR